MAVAEVSLSGPDSAVFLGLSLLKEPRFLFGEGPADRRARCAVAASRCGAGLASDLLGASSAAHGSSSFARLLARVAPFEPPPRALSNDTKHAAAGPADGAAGSRFARACRAALAVLVEPHGARGLGVPAGRIPREASAWLAASGAFPAPVSACFALSAAENFSRSVFGEGGPASGASGACFPPQRAIRDAWDDVAAAAARFDAFEAGKKEGAEGRKDAGGGGGGGGGDDDEETEVCVLVTACLAFCAAVAAECALRLPITQINGGGGNSSNSSNSSGAQAIVNRGAAIGHFSLHTGKTAAALFSAMGVGGDNLGGGNSSNNGGGNKAVYTRGSDALKEARLEFSKVSLLAARQRLSRERQRRKRLHSAVESVASRKEKGDGRDGAADETRPGPSSSSSSSSFAEIVAEELARENEAGALKGTGPGGVLLKGDDAYDGGRSLLAALDKANLRRLPGGGGGAAAAAAAVMSKSNSGKSDPGKVRPPVLVSSHVAADRAIFDVSLWESDDDGSSHDTMLVSSWTRRTDHGGPADWRGRCDILVRPKPSSSSSPPPSSSPDSFVPRPDDQAGDSWRPAATFDAHEIRCTTSTILHRTMFATGGADSLVCLWSLSGPGSSAAPDTMDTAEDGGSGPSAGSAWSTSLVATLRGHEGPVSRVRRIPGTGGRHLLSTSLDGTLRLWDASRTAGGEGAERCLSTTRFRGSGGHALRALAVHPDSSLCCVGGDSRSAMVVDLRTGRSVLSLFGHTGPVLDAAFASDGFAMATGSEDHTVRIWDLRNKGCRRAIPAHSHAVRSVAFGPLTSRAAFNDDGDGACVFSDLGGGNEYLCSGSYDGTVRVWRPIDGSLVATLRGHADKVACVAPERRGSAIITAGFDRTVKEWKWE